MSKISQNEMILKALKDGEELSPLDILKRFGSLRASARIYDLRHGKHDGTCYDIRERRGETKGYAIYWLEKPKITAQEIRIQEFSRSQEVKLF